MRKLTALSIAGGLMICGAIHVSHAETYTFTTLAGSSATLINSAEGTGSAAQFNLPRGVAVDTSGNVYVADSLNNTVRKVTAAGVTTTLAGTPGIQGRTDGT